MTEGRLRIVWRMLEILRKKLYNSSDADKQKCRMSNLLMPCYPRHIAHRHPVNFRLQS